ncbi:MAG: 50S ribosomal protein L25 [Thermodesulfobacteriota bacterium]
MIKITLPVHERNETGKGPARRLRADGKIPAILYGRKREPLKLAFDLQEFKKLTVQSGANPLWELQITTGAAESCMAVVKEKQVRPVDGSLVHMDFQEISMTEPIVVTIPVHFDGKPVGVDRGGTFQHAIRELQISCLPGDVPEVIRLDVAKLDWNQSLAISDLPLPAGVKPLREPGTTVCTVLPPKRGEALTEEGAEAPAEATK